MSPKAIHSLIELFGVEKGVQILNLFTAPGSADVSPPLRRDPIVKRPKDLIRQAGISSRIATG